MGKDYYQILGLSKGASEADIKKAFRELAHKHHPDKEGGDEAKFKEINEAYQVLSNPQKKAQYDQYGQTFDQGGQGGFGGFGGFQGGGANFDMGDISEMFGDMFGFGGRGGGRRQARGGDIEVNAQIAFHEAAFGAEKTFELYKPVACAACSGTGIPPGAKMQTCKRCEGKGRVRQVQRTMLGSFETVATCGECHGAGNIPEQRCKECAGEGVKREKSSVTVKIPAGIDDGETIRVSGGGEAGVRGTPSGDLYLHIRVKSDPRFERDGFDVYSNLEIGFADAALGTTRPVETVDGELEIKIPSGVQSGEEIRLKSRGIPHLRGPARGDHFVRIIVKTPKHLSRKAKELLQELKGEGL
ncbi:MAG TPA: molecular chaperone DnaJ [Candidatus Baltobacteraceae bacterium]|nr:molecular chaperone DnaJ [Candidatus Baltobacteraceae bacterium]